MIQHREREKDAVSPYHAKIQYGHPFRGFLMVYDQSQAVTGGIIQRSTGQDPRNIPPQLLQANLLNRRQIYVCHIRQVVHQNPVHSIARELYSYKALPLPP